MWKKFLLVFVVGLILCTASCRAEDEASDPKVEESVGKAKEGSKTDDEVVQREEEAIKLDGLSVSQMKELRDKAEKHTFQAEVDRMMKLIINSLYKNKEIFLRELISNASDALDKIRFLAVTDKSALGDQTELDIRIKADKDNHILHITDTGIGMTKDDLVKNLGTIAKSGTSDFLQKMSDAKSQQEMTDMIGQFGVGFYSSFLVADRVIVTSKHNDDEQHIWESDANSFSVSKDPRGNTLGRGTTVSLHLKEEAHDFLEENTIKDLIKKYSQFINFNIYLWTSKTEMVDEPVEEEKKEPSEKKKEDEDATVEEEKTEEKPKTKKVEKTTWNSELMNGNKPIWTRKPAEIDDKEYNEFYKSFSKESEDPLAKTHFTAEGEVTFKSILFIPQHSPNDMFHDYGKTKEAIKMYVRRVFITDDFEQMLPKYLSFIKGVVDSDDLPLNVSRETLQQHKLLKVIKKKLVRKTLDMIKKISKEDYEKFWKEYSTNIKLGVMEDHSNRTRLAKLLRFYSSNSDKEMTTLADYIERMKDKQEVIYFVAGQGRDEVEKSPFVERLLKKGFEVLYLTEAVDEYCIQSLPEFEGKKFQNVAKEGLKIDESERAKENLEFTKKQYEVLTDWLKDEALKDKIEKAVVSERLDQSPCALVASTYGWSGNMERIMKAQAYAKADDPSKQYYATQKKTLEINPRHPLLKELKKRVEANKSDQTASDLAIVMYETAVLRSGYALPDTAGFAGRVERMMRLGLNIPLDAKVEEHPEDGEDSDSDSDNEGAEYSDDEGAKKTEEAAKDGEKKPETTEDEKKEEAPTPDTKHDAKKDEL